MDRVQPPELFLEDNPTYEQRWQALSLHNQIWLERWSQAGGGEVFRAGGLMCAYDPVSDNAGITISDFDVLQIGDQVDRMLAWCRERHVLNNMICWYLLSSPPGDLAARLFARGFDPSWQPHWMWFELRHLRRDHTRSSAFDIQIVGEDLEGLVADDLPNYHPDDRLILSELHRTHPRHVWQLVAFQEQRLVGRCLLHVTTGALGVAGLFSMGVVPSARKQGIGTALVQAACELAQQIGCHHVFLNATAMGEPVYRRVGFLSMGYGHTWFLRAQTLAAPAPTKDHVAFLEAVGLGDIAMLERIRGHLEGISFDEPAPSSLTPLDIAVRCQQPASAAWLIEHGAHLDLISAWDLGWKEQIPSLLAMHPELVNLQRGDWHLTPLHVAVERGEIELVKLLLTVPNDLTLKDTAFEATALGWAYHLGLAEIIPLIERHVRAV